MNSQGHSVYWIHSKDHLDMMSEGYIGVSKNAANRWRYGHFWAQKNGRHDNPLFSNAIAKHGWDNLIKEVLVIASEDYCYELEKKLRPSEKVGWNLAIGGGKPPVSKFRGLNYVSPLKGVSRPTPWLIGKSTAPSIEACIAGGKSGKGRVHSDEHVKKRQESRRLTRMAKGQIRPFIVNGVQYESSKVASDSVGIPEATLKYWAYGKGKPGPKYSHITECRWL